MMGKVLPFQANADNVACLIIIVKQFNISTFDPHY